MSSPKAISNGRNFLVWSTDSALPAQASIVEPDGSAVAVDSRALPQRIDAAASNGDVYCILTVGGTAVFVNVIDASGRPFFPEPRKLLDLPIAENRLLRGIEIARVHRSFRLFWTEMDTFFGARDADLPWALSSADFNPEGKLIAPLAVVATGVQRGSSSDFYSAYLDVAQAGPADAVVRWSFGSNLPWRQTTLGCGAVFASRAGNLASNGRTAILAGKESIAESRSAAVVRRGAFSCDPAALLAAPREPAGWAASAQRSASLTAGHRDAVAVYAENGRLHARRVSHSGKPLAWMALPEEVQGAQWFRVVSDGWEYVAFWLPEQRGDLRFAKLADAGSPLPDVMTVSAMSALSDAVDVQWNGRAYVVVWAGEGLAFGGEEPILATRVSRVGTLLDPEPIELVAPDPKLRRWGLALSRGADGMLLGWTDSGAGTGLPCSGCTNPRGVRALRIGPDGRASGSVLEFSGYMTILEAVLWNEGAWYLFIDGSGAYKDGPADIHALALGWTYGARIAPFPLGALGVGLSNGTSLDRFDSNLYFHQSGAPQLPDGLRPEDMKFAAAGSSRVLVLFTAGVEEAPYAGARRVFFSSLDLGTGTGTATPKRRAAR